MGGISFFSLTFSKTFENMREKKKEIAPMQYFLSIV
jgi:hypothetical protein